MTKRSPCFVRMSSENLRIFASSAECCGDAEAGASLGRSKVLDGRCEHGQYPHIHDARVAEHGIDAENRVCAEWLRET
jgi:hypothetical protein